MARNGPPEEPGYYSDDDPTQYAANYSEYTQPYPAGDPYGGGEPPEPPQPWYRKPAGLVAIGAIAALVLAAAIYGIIGALSGDSSPSTSTTTTTTTTSETATTSAVAPAPVPTETVTAPPETTTTTEPTTTTTTTPSTTTTTTTETTPSVSTSVSTVTETQTETETVTPEAPAEDNG